MKMYAKQSRQHVATARKSSGRVFMMVKLKFSSVDSGV